jgi:serine/threonine protein phosphatase 1
MRILAIGDIHGCLTALDALLALVAPQPDDLLITLGDYADRGPDSRGVIDRLIELRAKHRLVALRGNHDVMMLDARDGEDDRMWLTCGGRETMASYGARIRGKLYGLDTIPEAHWKFLEELVDWYETDNHFYVHGNVEPDLPFAEQSPFVLHWEKLGGEAVNHCSGKTMICGHTKQYSGRPLDLGTTICIDTGAYDARGWLTCLDVERRCYWQANQAGETRMGELEQAPGAGNGGHGREAGG